MHFKFPFLIISAVLQKKPQTILWYTDRCKWICLCLLIFIVSAPANGQEISTSENQSGRRVSNRWAVSFSRILKPDAVHPISLQYNINSSFSVQGRFLYDSKNKSDMLLYPPDGSANDGMLLNRYKESATQIHTAFLLKYYPFHSFFYLGAGFGRDSGRKHSLTSVDVYRYAARTGPTFLQTDNYEYSISSYNYSKYTVGIDWIFSSGIFLGLELTGSTPLDRRKTSNFYMNPISSLNNADYVFLLKQSLLWKRQVESANYLDGLFVNIGYAF